MDPEVETVLYRIIQEGLHNVVKHADAKNVSIHLTHSYPDLILTIKDDGVGFDQNENIMSSGRGNRESASSGCASGSPRGRQAGGPLETGERHAH